VQIEGSAAVASCALRTRFCIVVLTLLAAAGCGGSSTRPRPPVGLGAVRAVVVRQILTDVERGSPANALVQDVDLRPTSVIVNVVDPTTRRLRSWGLGPGGRIATRGKGEIGDRFGVPFSQIDPDLPERLARAVLRRTHAPVSELEQVTAVISPVAPRLTWAVTLEYALRPHHSWIADADGRHLRENR